MDQISQRDLEKAETPLPAPRFGGFTLQKGRAMFFLTMMVISALFVTAAVKAETRANLPTTMNGVQGSAGAGFTDFSVRYPDSDFRLTRGIYVSVTGERSFNFMHLYFTLSLSRLEGDGTSNYTYTNLSSSKKYTVSDIAFRSKMTDIALGLKFKLIDDYWFRPYVEGGVLGGYHEIAYTTKISNLESQGNDYKKTDTIMAGGTYGEAGIEVQLSDNFGAKVASRLSQYRTKPVETLNNYSIELNGETYYFHLLVNF